MGMKYVQQCDRCKKNRTVGSLHETNNAGWVELDLNIVNRPKPTLCSECKFDVYNFITCGKDAMVLSPIYEEDEVAYRLPGPGNHIYRRKK